MTDRRSRGRRTLRGLAWIAGLAALAVAGERGWLIARYAREAAGLPAAEAAARAQGLPLSGAEMAADPPVPADQNAAPGLRGAVGLIERLNTDRAALASRRDIVAVSLTADAPDAVRRGLAGLAPEAPALTAAARALDLPRVDWARDYSGNPALVQFPEYAGLKQLAEAAARRAVLRAAAGDGAGAASDLRLGWRLAATGEADPMLIGAMVRVAGQAVVVRHAEYALAVRPRDPELLGAVADLAADEPAIEDLIRILRGETLFGASAREMLDDLPSMGMGEAERIVPWGVPRDLAARAYRTRALADYADLAARMRQAGTYERAAVVFGRSEEQISRGAGSPSDAWIEIVKPVFTSAADACLKALARQRLIGALGRVLEHRDRTGRWPADLAAAGVTAADPFDGGPLRYRVREGRVTIWSVGGNRRDDDGIDRGGVTSLFRGDGEVRFIPAQKPDDVVVEFPRRPSAGQRP